MNHETKQVLSRALHTTIPSNVGVSEGHEIWSRVRANLHLTQHKRSNSIFQRHLKSYSKHQDYINKVVRNASPYFFFVLEEVEKRGMPSEIALLPIIESDFNPHTQSHKGALGLWQIMPELGKDHGLKQNALYDGRKDIYESTRVALDHLVYLHKKFNGDWLLAIAAYNCGEVRMQKAIKQNRAAKKSIDFWTLKLPKQTMDFVPKLLALATVIKSPKEYGIFLPTIQNKPMITRVHIDKSMDIAQAAKLVDVSETQLRKLNPGLKKSTHLNSASYLVVPIHQAHKFSNKLIHVSVPKIPNKANAKAPIKENKTITVSKKSGKTHKVKKGESIPKICKRYGIAVSTLLKNNNLKSQSAIIQPGQKLIIST